MIHEKPFWSMSPADVAHALTTHTEAGLSPAEAERRLTRYGKNTIDVSKRSPRFKILLRQFTSPLIIILLCASAVTIAISHYRDSLFILVAVIVNAILGFYQEDKAEQALSELETYLKQRARVIRDGVEKNIDAEEIVPGDLVRLSQGDRVPADGRIIFANDLQIDESVLTGESLPVTKSIDATVQKAGISDQTSMSFAGTLVTQGLGTLIVCRTNQHTEFGKIASAISASEHEETPLQKAIKRFSIHASLALSILTIAIFFIGILAGYSTIKMFLTSVAIAVSAIPEGLPVALTVILSVGVQRMAQRKGVVRKLIAAETLGDTTVILTDKTGTLTMARMELTDVITLNDLDQSSLLKRGLATAMVIIENPTDSPEIWRMDGRIMETSLVKGAALRGVRAESMRSVVQSLPFNAVRKYSAAIVREHGEHILTLFGAPDILLEHSTLSAEEKKNVHQRIHELASTGKRVLGIAHKKVELTESFSINRDIKLTHVSLDGLVVFHDPVRPHVQEAIERVAHAGIRTIIMTGDHSGTAQAIAREIGIDMPPSSTLDASELATLSEEELRTRLPLLRVISRVTPFDKLRIAKLYQAAGEVVAMTGDGVNDAPSIKQADVGIAMGSGTEVSRSVADLVLLDDNFETIVAAVEEGRQIMGNIRKVLVYLLSNVTDGLILIGGSLLVGIPLPLNALQILWVNFFSDSFPAIAFAFEKESDALFAKPQKVSQGLFDPLMRFLILTIGISTSALLFVLYWALLNYGYDEALVRTFVFAAFGSYTLFVALSVRSLDRSIFSYPLFSNMYLIGGIAIGLVLMALAIYVPFLQSFFDTVALPWTWVVAVVAVGVVNITLIEFGKWLFRNKIQ